MKEWLARHGISEAWLMVNDQDAEWWPFVFLKPRPDESLSQTRIFWLASLYAFPIALFFTVMTRLQGESIQLLTLCVPAVFGAHLVL